MKTRIRFGTLLVALLVTAAWVVPAAADDGTAKLRKPVVRGMGTVTGEFSGRIAKQFRLGEARIVVTKKTVVRTVSGKMLELGDHVSRSRLMVMGRRDAKGRIVADLILVRDASGEGRKEAGVLPDDVAR